MKRNFLIIIIASCLILACTALDAQQRRISTAKKTVTIPTTTTTKTISTATQTTTATQSTATTTKTKLIPCFIPGNTYTVGEILSRIRTNNPKADFVMRVGTTNFKSASDAGLAGLISQNLDTEVIIQQDKKLLDLLADDPKNKKTNPLAGQLTSDSKADFGKILLYFNLDGYTLYVVKPIPGEIIQSARTKRVPVLSLIEKWDLSKTE